MVITCLHNSNIVNHGKTDNNDINYINESVIQNNTVCHMVKVTWSEKRETILL